MRVWGARRRAPGHHTHSPVSLEFTAETSPLPRGASAPDGSALLHGQLLAVVNKTDGDRARTYSPLAQPSLVGSTCAVGEPAPPATP